MKLAVRFLTLAAAALTAGSVYATPYRLAFTADLLYSTEWVLQLGTVNGIFYLNEPTDINADIELLGVDLTIHGRKYELGDVTVQSTPWSLLILGKIDGNPYLQVGTDDFVFGLNRYGGGQFTADAFVYTVDGVMDAYSSYWISTSTTAVPESSTYGLAMAGLAIVLSARQGRRK